MKKFSKIIALFLVLFGLTSTLSACGTPKADYSESKAESLLNKGDDLKGKTIKITAKKLEPSSAFGYNVEAGKHLNFVSSDNPKIKKGQTEVVKVKKVSSVMGSYVITYDLVK